jgi:hypothetical protein
MQGAFTNNKRLQAQRVFQGVVDGSGELPTHICLSKAAAAAAAAASAAVVAPAVCM